MSPSVIGTLDITNPFNPIFKRLKAEERTFFKEIIIENTVASIVLLAESCRETADPNKITGNREKIT
ncbi:11377_t:CDS:2, partial [Entrophospora sp. SA101]